jgi:hypothetical protein
VRRGQPQWLVTTPPEDWVACPQPGFSPLHGEGTLSRFLMPLSPGLLASSLTKAFLSLPACDSHSQFLNLVQVKQRGEEATEVTQQTE